MQFVKHVYIDKPPRFYIDGIRVSAKKYSELDTPVFYRFDCFLTKRAKDDHYIHYKSATII